MLINHRYFSVFRTAARGLEAQRMALGATSENIANATTTRTAAGTPYQVKRVAHEVSEERYRQFGELLERMTLDVVGSDRRHLANASLRRRLPEMDLGPTTEVQEEARTRLEFDPTHPHADAQGYVAYPDVNVVEEMARMISANRIYEANLSTVHAAKEMIKRTLEI
jgi:flagellar basal-body rod protein FlgC